MFKVFIIVDNDVCHFVIFCFVDEKVHVKIEPDTDTDDKPNILKRKLGHSNHQKKFLSKKVKEEYLPPVSKCMLACVILFLRSDTAGH